MITLHTSRGELTGPSIPVVVATEWGPAARFSAAGDDARLGQIIERDESQPSAWHVLGTVTSAVTPDGEVHYEGGDWIDAYLGDVLSAVRSATEHLAALRQATDAAESSWRIAIQAALLEEQRVVDVAAAAGISRERVYQIRDGRR